MLSFVLFIVVAALAVFVGGYLLRDTPIRSVRSRGASEGPRADGQRVRRLFEVLANADLEPGNRIEVLANGERLFPRLFADLAAAERLITIQLFWFKPGSVADRIAETLLERARAGVEVLVLLDWFGSSLPNEYVGRLRDGGVDIRFYRPLAWKGLYKVPHRSHVRSIVIDSRVGYTGGLGIDDQWLGDGRSAGQWRDSHVRIEGPIVDHLRGPFLANWAECTGELLFGDDVVEGAEIAGDDSQRAAVMYAAPSLGSTTAERFVALTIAAARETLYVTSAYFVPGPGFRNLLTRAVADGVDVRILTPGANTDRLVTWYAGRAHYEELLRSGIRIYEYRPTMLHAKTFVADRIWLSVGSINFDNRSLKLNDEVALVAQNADLGRTLHELFLEDLEHADEVDLDAFRRRGRLDRARERGARLISPLL